MKEGSEVEAWSLWKLCTQHGRWLPTAVQMKPFPVVFLSLCTLVPPRNPPRPLEIKADLANGLEGGVAVYSDEGPMTLPTLFFFVEDQQSTNTAVMTFGKQARVV